MIRKFRKYDVDLIEKAVSDIQINKITIRLAAEKYKIPKSTLYDRLSGKISESKMGPARIDGK